MQPAILGIDAGTSALKGVVYDRHGTALFTAQQAYRLATPQPGWAELDMEAVWRALVDVLRTVAAPRQARSASRPGAGCPGRLRRPGGRCRRAARPHDHLAGPPGRAAGGCMAGGRHGGAHPRS